MADAHCCKHCGRYEGTHQEADQFPEKLPGYRFAVTNCPGFELSKRAELRISRKRKQVESSASPIDHFVALLTPAGVVDIGS